MKNSKNFAQIAILSAIFVFIAGIACYLGIKNKTVSTSTPIATVDLTTDNWQRHNFPKMGYSIAFPPDWYSHDGFVGDETSYEAWASYPVDNPSPQAPAEGQISGISMGRYPNPDTSLNEDANKRLNDPYVVKGLQKSSSELGGEKSIVLKAAGYNFILVDHNGTRYYFQFGSDDPNIARVLDQIISTVKFIN